MAISTQIQNLNLIPGKSAPVVVHLSQGNVGNTVQFYLYDGDNPYYPTNVSIAVHGVRADNTVFGPYAVSVTSGSNLVSFSVVSAMTSVTGAAIGELVITDNNQNQIGSANFGMLVEETPYSSSVTYEDDLSIYQRILAYVQSIPASISGQIASEADARTNMDTSIWNALNTETSERKSADTSLNDSISSEKTARSMADANLQSQINQIVAPSGEAPSAAEVQNARIGSDGVTYSTLGDAIRTPITKLQKALIRYESSFSEDLVILKNRIVATHQGYYYNNSNVLTANAGYNAIDVSVEGGKTYSFKHTLYFSDNFCHILDIQGNVIGRFTASYLHTENGINYATMPDNAFMLHLSCGGSYASSTVVLEGKHDLRNVTQIEYPVNTAVDVLFANDIKVIESIKDSKETFRKVINYLDPSNWNYGHYWSSTTSKESAGYSNMLIENIPSGTYFFNRCAAPFVYVHDRILDAVKRGSTDYGLSDSAGTVMSITVSNPFDLYITVAGNANTPDLNKVYFATEPIGDDYFVGKKIISDCGRKTFYCGKNREYTKLKDVILAATQYFDSIVYVDGEEFDLVQEYGQNYLDSYSTRSNFGPVLKNRIHCIFGEGNKVLFNYTGNNEIVNEFFSPINTGEFGFCIENANVISNNCRYSVHDERSGKPDYYHNIYERCSFVHDSSNTSWGAHTAIGGGFGQHGDIVYRNCTFRSTGVSADMYYHNNYASDSLSKIIVENCYFSGTCFISNHGDSTEKSMMYTYGGSYSRKPFKDIDATKNNNVDIIVVGAEIRE